MRFEYHQTGTRSPGWGDLSTLISDVLPILFFFPFCFIISEISGEWKKATIEELLYTVPDRAGAIADRANYAIMISVICENGAESIIATGMPLFFNCCMIQLKHICVFISPKHFLSIVHMTIALTARRMLHYLILCLFHLP